MMKPQHNHFKISPLIAALIIPFIHMNNGIASERITGSDCTITNQIVQINIGNIFHAPDTIRPIQFSCDGFLSDKSTRGIIKGYKPVYCYHIHGGIKTGADYPLREASKNYKTDLYFTLQGKSDIVGESGFVNIGQAGSMGQNIGGVIPWNGKGPNAKWVSHLRLHFDGNDPTQSLPSGIYKYTTGSVHAVIGQIPISAPLTRENLCGSDRTWSLSGGDSETEKLKFNIEVKTYCMMKVSQNLNFGKRTILNKEIPATAILNVDCSAGTDYDVKLDKGLHPVGDQRRMYSEDTKQFITYDIDKDAFSGVGIGTSSGQNYNIKGTVPVQETPYPGPYRDTIVVTLTRHTNVN